MEHQINEEIRDKEVRLIGDDGEQLGILPIQQAQDIAVEKGMDLVKIAPQAKPPVCKIMDYGKFRFEQAKREKEARKNQRVVEIKEIRLTPNIDIGDLNTKVKNACRFLQDGNKLKVTIRFRGRQIAHSEIGNQVMQEFAERIKDYGTVERRPVVEGRNMTMMVAPRDAKKDSKASD